MTTTKLDASLTLPRHLWPKAFRVLQQGKLRHETVCGDSVIVIHLSADGAAILRERHAGDES